MVVGEGEHGEMHAQAEGSRQPKVGEFERHDAVRQVELFEGHAVTGWAEEEGEGEGEGEGR